MIMCPLKVIGGHYDYCEKKGCAWWLVDKGVGMCAIAKIALSTVETNTEAKTEINSITR